MLIKKTCKAHLVVLFVKQLEIENLVFYEFIYRNPSSLTILWYQLSIQVGLRCLEQWQNLLENFLKFLPTTSTFKTSAMNTERYIWLKGRFQCKNSEAYLSFMCFAAQDFEAFLRRFQVEQPMIHMLYPSMVEIIWSIMTKFVKKKYLVLENGSPKKAEDITSINPWDQK